MRVKPEPKKDNTKLQTKSQSRANSRKTSYSPSKKDQSSISSDFVCAPGPVESQVVSDEVNITEGSQPTSSCRPAHKVFQRTLSPADVLHVHSYAKGDYGEGEAPPKEEKKNESSELEAQKDNRHVNKSVSAYTHFILCLT